MSPIRIERWYTKIIVLSSADPCGEVEARIDKIPLAERGDFYAVVVVEGNRFAVVSVSVLLELFAGASTHQLAMPLGAIPGLLVFGPALEAAAQGIGEAERLMALAGTGALTVLEDGEPRAILLDAERGLELAPMWPSGDYLKVPVFYATDRACTPHSALNNVYSGGRGQMEWGRLEVSIPHDHRMGDIERPTWWKLWQDEDPSKHVVLLSLRSVGRGEFIVDLRTELAGAAESDLLVFVHGYNTSFVEAARRTAQIAYDLKFQGLPLMYSWPSDDTVPGYTRDEADVEWGYNHFVDVMHLAVSEVGAETVHLIAHSMGNRTAVNALRMLALNPPTGELAKLRHVVFAAPDIDADTFVQYATEVWPHAETKTLYASAKDKALKASEVVHGANRAGRVDPVVIAHDVDTIDATAVETGFLHHAYFGDNVSIITDIKNMIEHNETPDRRPGLTSRKTDVGEWWVMQV